MGTFAGHILPGTFFIIFAVWWNFMTTLRYIKCKKHNDGEKKYSTSITMPCICCPYRIQKHPVESLIKFIFSIIGIIAEVATGIKIHKKPEIISPNNLQTNIQISTWHFEGVNAQHSTMYAAFAIGAIVEILIHYKIHVPQRLDYIMGIIAFGVEALLFYFHLHGRDQLDIQIHVLLILSVFGCVFSCILEYINPHNILFTYSRILCTFLQGTWFYQAGFILYPPFKWLENRWDSNNHMHIMFITAIFIWHVLIIFLALLLHFVILNHFYGTKNKTNDNMETLEEDAEQVEYLMLSNKDIKENSDVKANKINETSLSNTLSDDESEIEFDNSKLIKKNSNNSSNIKSESTDRKR